MMYILGFIILNYVVLISTLIVGFDRIKIFESDRKNVANTFSIVIPFRNESSNLPDLLKSLTNLNYPTSLFEIIFIDDESTDNSIEIINNNFHNTVINYRVISNKRKSQSPKKDAIETAILASKHNWIVTTDADCIVPKNWLKLFDDFIEINNSKMICGPVTYKIDNAFLQKLQLLDFISLIGSTIGGFGIEKPFLCNGANLCYSKKAFLAVNGFEGNNNISSGDDIFLLQKMNSKFPSQIHYLKSMKGIVYTKPETTLKKLLFQRVRWASKSKYYKSSFSKLVGILVFLTNFSLAILLLSSLLNLYPWSITLSFLALKFMIDFILIFKTLIFANQLKNIFIYPITSIVYPFFIVFVFFYSFYNKSFEWKSRTFKA